MKAVQKQVQEYMENATLIRNALTDMGYEVYGGVNAPYIWLKVPGEMGSWEFFDLLLNKANVVGTPGEGFGKCGEGYFRLTAFGDKNDTIRAMQRLKEL